MAVRDRWTPEGERFRKQLKELAGLEVRAGFQSDGSSGEGTDITDIAMWNELGTVNIPSRPFMRDSVDKHADDINRMLAEQKAALLGGATAEDILNAAGIFIKDLMQTEIEQGDFVPNAPQTIRRKGSDKPLIDTGRMKNSVNYWVVKKGSAD